ncbi:MAG: hypothetical protein ACI8WB_004500 [Phenylobacterium sp.]|jgi:hypothetical protein
MSQQVTKQMLNDYLQSVSDGEQTEGEHDPFFQLYQRYLEQRYTRLATPGKVLLVIGTGRNGSTSIAAALRCLPNSLISHERPPLLPWYDGPKQLQFHLRFIEISRQYFEFVGDVSHWWLPHLDTLRARLGGLLVIHLQRESAATIQSFIKLKSRPGKSFNHWVEQRGLWWTADSWDPCYPNIPLSTSLPQPDAPDYPPAVSRYVISEYVQQYHLSAQADVAQQGGLTLQLAELFSAATEQRLSEYLGVELDWHHVHLNQDDTRHSAYMTVFK